MKEFFNKLIDNHRYKKLSNTYRLKYESQLEKKKDNDEYVIQMQKEIITLQEKIINQKEELLIYKEKELERIKKRNK